VNDVAGVLLGQVEIHAIHSSSAPSIGTTVRPGASHEARRLVVLPRSVRGPSPPATTCHSHSGTSERVEALGLPKPLGNDAPEARCVALGCRSALLAQRWWPFWRPSRVKSVSNTRPRFTSSQGRRRALNRRWSDSRRTPPRSWKLFAAVADPTVEQGSPIARAQEVSKDRSTADLNHDGRAAAPATSSRSRSRGSAR